MKLLLAALLGAAIPALAQDPTQAPAMTGIAFDANVSGKTLIWSLVDEPWGTEEYLPNQQVQWARGPESCEIGHWYAQDGQICFAYEGTGSPSCWIFRLGSTGLTADLQGSGAPFLLTETGRSDDGLPCPGPDLGA